MSATKNVVKSIAVTIPEAKKPDRILPLSERILWTLLALVIYETMSLVPLYGVGAGGPADPLFYSRVIFASHRGTLLELGIGPIVNAGLIIQLLKGADIIKLDFSKPEDRGLFTALVKFTTILMALLQSVTLILSGVYGAHMPFSTSIIVIAQLMFATLVVMLLDEMVQKGWGIGSGISLFIFSGVAIQIFLGLFNPLPVGEEGMPAAPFGLVPYLLTAGREVGLEGLFFRAGGFPSLFSLFSTITVILIIVYIEGIRVEIPISPVRYRGFSSVYPIRLLYVTNIPVILTSALFANIAFFSQLIWSRFNPRNDIFFLNLLGTFNATTMVPTGGLALYVTPPGLITELFASLDKLIHGAVFISLMAICSMTFAIIWVEIGGLSPSAAAKSLLDARVHVPGFRDAQQPVRILLERYIPAVTLLGGILVGLLAAVSDLFNVLGTGIGILLMLDIAIQYYHLLSREQLEVIMPRLSRILGT